jgi:hypothetical protein
MERVVSIHFPAPPCPAVSRILSGCLRLGSSAGALRASPRIPRDFASQGLFEDDPARGRTERAGESVYYRTRSVAAIPASLWPGKLQYSV